MNRATAGLVVAFLLWSFPLHAQSVKLDDRTKSLSSLGKIDAEYRLGPGDLIEIGVFGVDNFHHTLRISASGIIKLPLLDPITAAGLTAAELEQRLTALLDGEVIKNPQVSVFVKEYRSQPVFVLGAVQRPGQYQITLQLKIVDVISMAGGLQSNAEDEAVIQRGSPEGGEEIIRVNLRALLEKGDSALNIVVHGGDVIHIQERLTQTVYLIGEVNHAGAFPLPPKQDLRVSQLIASAGGPMKTAKLSSGMLVRYNDKGQRQELPVDFGEILKGKKDDFVVRANDIIFVPGSKFKNFEQSFLTSMEGMAGALAWRIPIP
jgi:polysaccharide export outer membrane protein